MTVALRTVAPRRVPSPGLPSPRALAGALALLLLAGIVSTAAATIAFLRVPAPTGAFAVGRVDLLLVDQARTEPSEHGGGPRTVRVVAWYPAEAGSGVQAPYVPGYERIAAGLEASGELTGPIITGLRFVAAASREGAAVADLEDRYPVVLFSPGNATNVAFYAALAEEMASRGFVVVGIDHPYQVAAVDMGDRVATYEEPADPSPDASRARIDERVSDLSFVLDRLHGDGAGLGQLAGRLDLAHVGVAGHSNGGITAAELCGDVRIAACLNIDGQHAGGPFSSRPDPHAPTKPFLYLTKETSMHPALIERFERAGSDTYRVMVPAASHDAFADGARFRPRILPVDGIADHVLTVERQVVSAFFERYLRAADSDGQVLDGLHAPIDLYIEAYPLAGRPGLLPAD